MLGDMLQTGFEYARPHWAGLAFFGLFIGFLTGLFGVGGGFLITPSLKVLFGLPYPVAVGTSLLAILCTGSISAARHALRRNVSVRLGAIMAGGALLGAWLGRRIMVIMERHDTLLEWQGRMLSQKDTVINLTFLALMGTLVVLIAWETRNAARSDIQEPLTGLARRLRRIRLAPMVRLPMCGITAISLWWLTGMSLFAGILTGMLGVGGGIVMFPLLVYALGVPTALAVGTSAFQLLFASGLGALLYARHGLVDGFVALALFAGSMLGAELGVRVSAHLGARRLRSYFVLVILAGMAVVAWDLLFTNLAPAP